MKVFRAFSQDTGPRAASTSAYVRVSGSGAGCGSRWPLCNGEILPLGAQAQTLIEFVHRVTSALSLVIVSFLVVWSG
jgi:heme A synthase